MRMILLAALALSACSQSKLSSEQEAQVRKIANEEATTVTLKEMDRNNDRLDHYLGVKRGAMAEVEAIDRDMAETNKAAGTFQGSKP
jgi:hypothetical protein